MKKSKLLITLTLIVFSFSIGYPCTTFVLHKDNRIVFGRNFDWITGNGLVMTNPRNMEKVALVDLSERAIKWTSKFGSITFNQVGRDLPFGGINESGLVVEHMSLDETVYPFKDTRYAMGACQWIQFQLDNYSTIEEVMSSDTLLRIVDGVSKFHYLITDHSGHTAAIEFLGGKMVCHTGKSIPIEALANSTYEKSLNCYKNSEDTEANRSLYNFCKAAGSQQNSSYSGDSAIAYAFSTLNALSQGVFTKWSIVYDVTSMKIYFKVFETPTIIGEQKMFLKQPGVAVMKIVDFKDFDFSCRSVTKVLDLDNNHEGVVNQYFVDYSTGINRESIAKTFTFFKGWGINIEMKDEELDYLAKYPESFRCLTSDGK